MRTTCPDIRQSDLKLSARAFSLAGGPSLQESLLQASRCTEACGATTSGQPTGQNRGSARGVSLALAFEPGLESMFDKQGAFPLPAEGEFLQGLKLPGFLRFGTREVSS